MIRKWWRRGATSARRLAEARRAVTDSAPEYVAAKRMREQAEQTAEEFAERAVTLREIRLQNHITPSMFPPQGRTQG